ncbi:hypothetical protein [Clostridium sp. ATCC 25772]|uniref:hypothetical protein n=1 Tax=Clostridium sp. ATCC 25772 TaxID=1676991 RepID=UPI000781A6CD|nr:hypothetical protein [Clostridium sp. ATCC 25772]
MNDLLTTVPLYLNGGLIQDLSGLLIDGYIQTKTLKCITEDMGNARLEKYLKDTNKIEKDKSPIGLDGTNEGLTRGTLDGRAINREEYSISKTYATFSFFRQVRESMNDNNMYSVINSKDIILGKVKPGNHVEFYGVVSSMSILSNINEMIDTISCYDITLLNGLLPKDTLINYNTIINQLNMIKKYLTLNNTFDMIMDLGCCKAIINVHNDNFISKTTHSYDFCNCNCTVMGKVICVCNKNQHVDLLRKSCNGDFFRKLILNMKPYFEILEKQGIVLPEIIDEKLCATKINGPCIQIIPIAMYQ